MGFTALPDVQAGLIVAVATTGDLPPTETVGGIRYVLSNGKLYTTDGTTWSIVSSGGGSTSNSYFPSGWG